MKMFVTLFVVFAVASSALGSPVVSTTASFDMGKIAGRWYQIAGPNGGDNTNCATQDFTPRPDAPGFMNLTVLATNQDGSKHVEYGLAQPTENPNVFYLYAMPYIIQFPISFEIVDTDYDNYLIASLGYNMPKFPTIRIGMILSRTNSISDEKYAELTDVLINKVGVTPNTLMPVTQKDCKYWPVSEY